MRPTDFASLKIKAWQHALAGQERTERMKDAALERSEAATFYTLRGRVRVLRVMRGLPAASNLHRAGELQVDHIVIGHQGKTAMQRWELGSVAHRVAMHASVLVTVVP